MPNFWIENTDAITGCNGLPAACLQTIISSPPYWGLRDYDLDPSVWGGRADCQHLWGEPIPGAGKGGSGTPNGRNGRGEQYARGDERGQTCRACGAWLGCLGLEPSPEMYVAHLVLVFRAARRVLRDDGTLWLNLGDSYISGRGRYSTKQHTVSGQARDEVRPGGRPDITGHPYLKDKDLAGIPWRTALALQAGFSTCTGCGLELRSDLWPVWSGVQVCIDCYKTDTPHEVTVSEPGYHLRMDNIWHKPNPMPASVTDRPTLAHEYLFLFSKSGDRQFWVHPDRGGTRTQPAPDYRWLDRIDQAAGDGLDRGGAEDDDGPASGIMLEAEPPDYLTAYLPDGRRRYRRINLWQGHNYFYDQEAIKEPMAEYERQRRLREKDKGLQTVNRLKADGVDTGQTPQSAGGAVRSSARKGELAVRGTRNKRSVWTVTTKPFKGAHFATFPPDLIDPCIKAGTSERGCCPACGAPVARITAEDEEMTDSSRNGHKHQAVTRGVGETGITAGGEWRTRRTVDWTPTCACPQAATPVPCVAADLFSGAGTAALETLRHEREFWGTEPSPKYHPMSVERVISDRELFNRPGLPQLVAVLAAARKS